MSCTCRVAVIGAGAAGLVAARELHRQGHSVIVFEQNAQLGGTWVYNDQTESDSVGVDPDRIKVHSSLYNSLRTNLPREAMGFRDYPFFTRPGNDDDRRFPGHREVLKYLEEFGIEFGVMGMIKFETLVVDVRLIHDVDGKKWRVKSKKLNFDGFEAHEVFDAVVVCNGHYTKPRLPEIPGLSVWPGKQIHSHNYRTPEPFRDQVVVLIGSAFSAIDISRDIVGVAKEVHIASREVADGTCEKQPCYDNLWLHSVVEGAYADGTVVFRNGNTLHADVILHCTGYNYDFPFLETKRIVTVDDNLVGPLYKHVFPPVLAPGLSFVGLPWKALTFSMFELQSKWIAGVLSGRIVLPSEEEMMTDIEEFYLSLEASGIPKRYTHNIAKSQKEYNDWLAAQCGCPGLEEWRLQMYQEVTKNRFARPETYRDEWDDQHLVWQAHEDFSIYTSYKGRKDNSHL
ncbi:hypothetical protein ACFE04_015332 [Oxalis oulophora]